MGFLTGIKIMKLILFILDFLIPRFVTETVYFVFDEESEEYIQIDDEDEWFDVIWDISYLKVFGFQFFAHISYEWDPES